MRRIIRTRGTGQPNRAAHRQGQLLSRPGTSTPAFDAPRGLHPLNLFAGRDGLLYVPETYRPDQPAPLVVLLHGAGGNSNNGLDILRQISDIVEQAGLLLLVVDSRGRTWDVVLGAYGPDVAFLDAALEHVFAQYAVDPAHIALGGFSDGGSYALSLGLTNGDLFTHILAFSPGFLAPAAQRGTPAFFVSHGTHDSVLPIDRCSRRIVPQLEQAGYQVQHHEFDGPHHVPPDIARKAVEWFTADI